MAVDAENQPLKEKRTRKAFLSHMKHEVCTPINAIIGYSEILLEDAEELGQQNFIMDLRNINNGGKRLLSLVNDLFDPEKIEASEIDVSTETFGARIKHELRTPLNAVVGYTEMLLEHVEDMGKDAFRSDLQKIQVSGKRLLTFLDDIIHLTRMEAGKMDVDLKEDHTQSMIQNVVTSIRSLDENTGVAKDAEYGTVLVVDDNELNCDMLSRQLERQGYRVVVAGNGREAMKLVKQESFDLVLLDIIMPEINGYEVLQWLKTDESLRHIPVIMISALDEMDSVVRCISMGAADYLPKPFDPALLRARVNASLASKRMRDMEQEYLKQIQAEQEKSERLLLNILPKPVAERLKQGETLIGDVFSEATVLFADLVGFTSFAANKSPKDVVEMLNAIFSSFDKLAEQYHLEKIKTIGDSYMVAAGVPVPRPDHAEAVAEMALDMQDEISRLREEKIVPMQIRIGIHCGMVVAGIIGSKKFAYDLWGDTVNTASRMESNSAAGRILVSDAACMRLQDKYVFEPHGAIQVKGKGEMMTHWLRDRKKRK